MHKELYSSALLHQDGDLPTTHIVEKTSKMKGPTR